MKWSRMVEVGAVLSILWCEDVGKESTAHRQLLVFGPHNWVDRDTYRCRDRSRDENEAFFPTILNLKCLPDINKRYQPGCGFYKGWGCRERSGLKCTFVSYERVII